MKIFSTLLLLLLSIITQAQKPPIKFGKISEEELKMTEYEGDKSAAAVVLADYGESVISYNQTEGFQIEFERIRRIKILSKDGYDWANFEIPLYEKNNNDEKLYGLKALTVNFERNKLVETKLEKDGIFEEETSENWKKVKVTLPNVREGSVIDITYKVISPYLFNFQDWEFQTSIPVKWSEYVARIPEYFEYQRYSQGYIPFKISDQNSVRKSMTLGITERSEGPGITDYPYKTTFRTETIEFNEITFRWVSENVPAFVVEPYMTTYRDYISKMNFELAQIKLPNRPVELVMGTWDNINKELLESPEFGGVVKRSNFLNKIVEEIISEKSSDVEKIAAIYSYVKSNVQWDGNYRKYTDGNFKRVLDDSKGNSAEINLMLVSMLQKAELRADPVVISTRNHGFIRQSFPISSQFNYVICAVENDRKLILLDATDRSLSANMLPERCLNGKGFLISENNARWVELTPTVKTKTILGAVLSFENEGQLKGHVEITKEGYDGQEIRAEYNALGEDSYVNKLAEKNNWTIQSHGFENLNNLNEPVKEIYDLTLNETLHTDILYFNPMAGTAITENPFKSETREYPVDFGKEFEQISVIKMKIPEGYEMEEFPTPLAITLPERGGRYIYNIANSNGEIVLTSLLTISKGLYSQLEYPHLREFYNQIIAKQAEVIVLKKK